MPMADLKKVVVRASAVLYLTNDRLTQYHKPPAKGRIVVLVPGTVSCLFVLCICDCIIGYHIRNLQFSNDLQNLTLIIIVLY